MPSNIRLQPRWDLETNDLQAKTRLVTSSQHCNFINWQFQHQKLQRAPLMKRALDVDKQYLTEKLNVQPVMIRHCSQNPGGIRIHRKKLALMISRLTDRRKELTSRRV